MKQQVFVFLCFFVFQAFSQSTFATYSSDVKVVGIIDNEYFGFEGSVVVDNPNDRVATKGIQSSDFVTYSATSVSKCSSNSTYWVDYSNGTCDVGCCHGYNNDYDVAIPRSPLEMIMNPLQSSFYSGCSCLNFHLFEYLLVASPAGSCHRDNYNGTLYRFNQDIYGDNVLLDFCMTPENTPIYFHENVEYEDGTDYEYVLDVTFVNFSNEIDTSIFQIPYYCNCPYYN